MLLFKRLCYVSILGVYHCSEVLSLCLERGPATNISSCIINKATLWYYSNRKYCF